MAEESLPVFVLGCVECGKTVGGSEKACPRCGASFEDLKFECPFCGEPVSPTERRCASCHTEFALFAEEVSDVSAVDLDGPGAGGHAPEATAPDEGGALDYECPACGKPVSADDSSCPHCGARFEE